MEVAEAEIDAIALIYPDLVERKSSLEFIINVCPDMVPNKATYVALHITYPENYPEEMPHVTLEECSGILNSVQTSIEQECATQAQDAADGSFIYDLIEYTRSYLDGGAGQAALGLVGETERASKEEDTALESDTDSEAEPSENVSLLPGDPVTPATFQEWWTAYSTEMKIAQLTTMDTRPTGREIWERMSRE